jgi:hypothetical protein
LTALILPPIPFEQEAGKVVRAPVAAANDDAGSGVLHLLLPFGGGLPGLFGFPSAAWQK